ncbi:MAG: hypothetical protein MAG431_01532 [Chloroflexi bacterium]|nr:hypothetical protein [Chloroflexota bacterium]
MTYYADPSYEQAADESSRSHGCLSLFLLPPLAVFLVGFLFSGQVSAETFPNPTSTSTLAPKAALSQAKKAERSEKAQEVSSSEASDVEEKAPSGGQPLAEPSGELAALFTPEVLYWEDKILAWSERQGLDPNLVATVMQIESCGDPQATSGAGAMGLFQVMPYHFAAGENGYDPGTNALRGLGYLRQALQKGGSVRMAFAGYNGGITGAARGEAYWPSETVRYVYWGTGIYQAAQAGEGYSARLEEWLAFGGASLCRQAVMRQGE